MPVTMICPNLACRKTVTAPDGARGKVVRCGQCNQPFLVPIRGAGEPATAETGNAKDDKKDKKGR
jgi:hypothetical protein